ncbi:hypothetical protein BDZ94DRAFT_1266176 [Collybia nuda]|uniref:Uncharacterized protein n=1 Tax=Collybia nuda TaxID=64659 RepID=A0A9P5Y142_9AGAR|nr:hypothetical protein BDZ94DRAFT_1266176 [Collybia nuda]
MKLVHLVYIHGFQGNDTTFQVSRTSGCSPTAVTQAPYSLSRPTCSSTSRNEYPSI